MTEKTVLIANELLYYLFSNVKFLDNPNFVAAAFEFYTAEEINVAKNQLLADMESLKSENFKFSQRSSTRKEKTADKLAELVAYVRQIVAKLPCYVSCDMNRVPKISLVNVEAIFKKMAEIEQLVSDFTSKFIENSNYVQSIANKLEHVHKFIGQPITDQRPTFNSNVNNSTRVYKYDTFNSSNMQPFTVASGNKKRLLTEVITSNTSHSNLTVFNNNKMNDRDKHETGSKIIGRSNKENIKIRANKVLVNKSFFYVSNLDNSCTADDIMDHLRTNNINVISCFDIKRPETQQESSATTKSFYKSFRVGIDSRDTCKIIDPDIWPSNVLVREWFFKKSTNEGIQFTSNKKTLNENLRTTFDKNTTQNG
ncbi:hypothetical protein HELRODRAFT_175731 [Helobdella robusta]|uniref:Uncharacterized protein n=1 Tax=Helobdella robusta TaxID=6412 RepID=T1F9L4_HELRO|nr:hypothetical protein HELRODRAFT_175731 [Helobdella robusta]ESO00337.1 hypothetical protein HELRODRAFT_175731 [Helobdella robusta]